MTQYQFAKRVRGLELMLALEAAGFPSVLPDHTPRLSWRDDLGLVWVACDPEEYDAAASVVAAHDAAAIDAAAAAEQQTDDDDRATLRQVVAVLLADADRLRDTTVTMSAQVIRNHVARTDDVLAGLLRVLRRRGVI